MLELNKLNPHTVHTPEWQLYENAVGSYRAERAHLEDAARSTEKAQQAREKAVLYEDALQKLALAK